MGESGVVSPVHISATALLQKAAQFGATISNKASAVTATAAYTGTAKIPHNTHVSVTSTDSATKQTQQKLSSREDLTTITGPANNISGIMTSFSNGFDGSTMFEDAILFGGFNNLNSKKENEDEDQQLYFNGSMNEEDHILTKDFLGLKPLSHTDDIFNIAALVNTEFKNHKTWQS